MTIKYEQVRLNAVNTSLHRCLLPRSAAWIQRWRETRPSVWQAEVTFIRFFSDIQKHYSGYLKKNL